MDQGKTNFITNTPLSDLTGHHRNRRVSEISITTPDEDFGHYDAEATLSVPRRNFIGRVKKNINRACQFLSKIEPNDYNNGDYGAYPLGNGYTFKDWETW